MKSLFKSTHNKPGLWAFASLALGLLFTAVPAFVAAQYQGAEYCADCHDQQYHDWLTSGHKQILMEGVDAQHRSLPLPAGQSWGDISYTVGGNRTKTLYLNNTGYIITGSGNNQFNLLTGEWSNYHAGENNLVYDCGECHTTGYQADGNQLPGISGTFALPGVQCERCHGPGDDMELPSTDASFCGECHSNGPSNVVAASGGFIKPEGQYNEFLAGAHASQECVTCHNPHQNAKYGIVTQCETCHASKAAAYAGTVMDNAGVECKDCHMPYATLSAQALGPHQGDERTHIFRINADPSAPMFSPDGSSVVQVGGEAAVTLDFVCQRCHGSSSKAALAQFAKGFHDNSGSLANFGLDPGLSGTWYKAGKDGEGFLLEVFDEIPDLPVGEDLPVVRHLVADDRGCGIFRVVCGQVRVDVPPGCPVALLDGL
ncbi:MAG: cytochrome c3 family protein, partial [Xanthomonadales bacterium]|nr:cytochrome c3 family protein [Xanthomonadales bacterium]